MTNINEQINKLETKLNIILPADYRKFLQHGAQDQLIDKCFYDCLYWNQCGCAGPKTITCIFSTDQLLERKQEYIKDGYFHIGVAGGEDMYIGINKDTMDKIFCFKWVGFHEYFINPEDVDTFRKDDIYGFELIADSLKDFSHNLLPKLPGVYKKYNLYDEKIEKIKNLQGTARLQYLISMALSS